MWNHWKSQRSWSPLKRKRMWIPGTVMMLIAIAVMGPAAMANNPEPEPQPEPESIFFEDGRIDLTKIKEDVIREMFDNDGNRINPKQKYIDAATDNPGGFGGWYREGTIVYVWTEDPSDQTATEAAFRQAYSGDRETTAIIPVQANHSYDKLWNWWKTLDSQMNMADITVTSSSVVSQENTIKVGLADLAESGIVKEIMALNKIPETAVTIVQMEWRLN